MPSRLREQCHKVPPPSPKVQEQLFWSVDFRLHGQDNATVLDPFLGAGTTLVAAQALGLAEEHGQVRPSLQNVRNASGSGALQPQGRVLEALPL